MTQNNTNIPTKKDELIEYLKKTHRKNIDFDNLPDDELLMYVAAEIILEEELKEVERAVEQNKHLNFSEGFNEHMLELIRSTCNKKETEK